MSSLEKASHKLMWIINRYGTDNGNRLDPEYLLQLAKEAESEQAFSEFTKEIHKLRSV